MQERHSGLWPEPRPGEDVEDPLADLARRRRIEGSRQQERCSRVSRVDREVALADAPKGRLPLRAGQLVGGLNLGHEPIGHQVEQLVLIADVVVEGHGGDPQPWGQLAQADRFDPGLVGHAHRLVDDADGCERPSGLDTIGHQD